MITNRDIRGLVMAGFACMKYKGIESSKTAYKVVCICRALARAYEAIEEERLAIIRGHLEDRFDDFAAYQAWKVKSAEEAVEKPEGLMTDDEYRRLSDEAEALVDELFNAAADVKFPTLTFDEYLKVAAVNEGMNLEDTQLTMNLEGVLWEGE